MEQHVEYKKPTEEILEQLRQATNGHVYTGADIKEDFSHDEMPSYGTKVPDAVVECSSTEEVAAVCKLCYDNDIPITTRGAGTGLSCGCVALYGGIVLDTTRMNHILGYDDVNMTVRAECGVLLNDLAEDCLKKGYMYPPDPGEKFATIGGNVATNAGGMRACKYGTTRQYVRAMTVVLPTGEICRFGAEVSKNTSGYSLENLMIGSEGTLGVITEVSLKLVSPPKYTLSMLALFEGLPECMGCVSKVKMTGVDPQALEFLSRANVDDIEEYLGKKIYPKQVDGVEVGYYLLTTLEYRKEEEADELMETVSETFVENGALDVVVYDTPEAFRNVWLVRGSVMEMLGTKFKQQDECDIVVPLSRVAELVEYIVELQDEVGMEIRATGHAGDGNVHINACTNGMDPEEFKKRVQIFIDRCCAKGAELEGLVSGEHGIGAARVTQLENAVGEVNMRLMREIKRAFDPKFLFNPGKVCWKLEEEA